MSLKTQLRVSIVMLVTGIVLMLCVVTLHTVADANFRAAVDRAQSIAAQVQHSVSLRLTEQAARSGATPATVEESKEFYHQLVERDFALSDLLEKMMASSQSVVEIMICDDAGRILATSDVERERMTYESLPDFAEWQSRSLWDRLMDVFLNSRYFATSVPLGIELEGVQAKVLQIRVVLSSVLIRTAIKPQVITLSVVSLLSLLASVILGYLFSNVVLRSLDRLSQRIESITRGQAETAPAAATKEVKEIAEVQSKLDVLSEQFRGARDDMVQLRGNIERMLDRLEDVVLLFDPTGVLLQASRSVETLLGQAKSTLEGRTLSDLLPAASPLGALVRQAMETRATVRDAPISFDRPRGGSARLMVNIEILEGPPQSGRPSILVSLRDVETRRQLRSQIDLSTRHAAISRLTGGVAHEIKNPLNAIALHLEILRSKIGDGADGSREVDVIGGEIARLDRVVKTFLDFTRPVEMSMDVVDLRELARQVAALVWPEAERRGVSVEWNSPDPAVFVRGDEDLLKQALINVVANGMEAMTNGGRLTVDVHRHEGEAVVNVTDQGAGIPESVRSKIFDLYFSTKEKGSGIGLAMTFRIVQFHNGTIDFSSESGKGTRFQLRFPVADGAEEPLVPVAAGLAARTEVGE